MPEGIKGRVGLIWDEEKKSREGKRQTNSSAFLNGVIINVLEERESCSVYLRIAGFRRRIGPQLDEKAPYWILLDVYKIIGRGNGC